MSLSELSSALRRFRLLVGLVVLSIAGLSALAALLPANTYSATTTVQVTPNVNDAAIYGSVLNSLQYVMPSLATQVQSRRVHTLVKSQLAGSTVGKADVTLVAVGDPSGLLTISATSHNRAAVDSWANAGYRALVSLQPARNILQLRVLDIAQPAESASGPPRLAVLIGGVALSLIAGTFAALGANALTKRQLLGDEISRRLGIQVLAEVPRLRGRRKSSLSIGALYHNEADPAVVEAFQRLRTNLEIASTKSRPAAIAISSQRTGEGKSTVAAILAWSLASAGYPLWLVDADLRLPTQHVRFGAPSSPGLADVGRLRTADVLCRTPIETLQLLPAGHPDMHPSDALDHVLPLVLADGNTAAVMTIVDTPPVQVVSETLRIAVLVGHVVLVVDARTARLDELTRTVELLRGSGIQVMGVVLNRVSRRRNRLMADKYYEYRRPEVGSLEPVSRPRKTAAGGRAASASARKVGRAEAPPRRGVAPPVVESLDPALPNTPSGVDSGDHSQQAARRLS